MRILHVIQRYPPAVGGSETWCAEVARYEASTGDDVQVLTLDVLEETHYWEEPGPGDRLRRLGHLDWDGPVLVERCPRSLPVPLVHHLILEGVLDKRLGLHVPGPIRSSSTAACFRGRGGPTLSTFTRCRIRTT